MKLNTAFYAISLILSIQGCNEDNAPNCDCEKTDFVLDFIDKEGVIYYADDGISLKAWVISVNSSNNSQTLVGKICNMNSPSVKTMIKDIPSEPFSTTPVIFSGRVTQLCPEEPRPTTPANISYFYLKIDTINLK